MLDILILGVILGMAGTLLWQDAIRRVRAYQDRKQSEFEAAVRAETEFRLRRAQLHDQPKERDPWDEIFEEI